MSFESQPSLKCELVELRPLRSSDYGDLYAAAADPLIWEQHPDKDRYKEEGFRRYFQDALASNGALIAIDPKSNRVIGSSRFHAYSEERREVEIGSTFLARAYWGGLYNRAIKELMLIHAFKYVDSVKFVVGIQNIRSQRAIEKIGGVRIDTRNDGGGQAVIYQITSSAFAGG